MQPQALQSIALAVAEARSVNLVLQRIVEGLAGQPGTALARIWLRGPGDLCSSSCRVRAECPDQRQCLHLRASAGRSTHDSGADWTRLTGDFRRIPLNMWKVGHIGGTGTPLLIAEDLPRDPAIARPEWASAEGIMAFAGQPLIFKGEILGVLAVFSRDHIDQEQFQWLRTFADQAAVALANARAFEEVARLSEQIELERDHLREVQAYLAEAQRLSVTGSFGWKPASGEIVWSDETYRIFDIACGTKPTIELALARVHPEDRETLQQVIDRAAREAQDLDREYRLMMSDGTVKHLRVVAQPTHNALTSDTEYVGAVMDITAAKESRQALEKAYAEIQRLKEQLQKENIVLREEIDQTSMFEIVGASPALKTVLSYVSKVAPMDSTVLITGETGTGKELIARAIHKRSPRSSRAFVTVNCAAIPSALIASELFGHEKGAFTGAVQRRHGRFELADGGTLFLDEVGELPADTQIMLLRVLQEHEFERVGGSGPVRVNVRVIAATNRDLQAAVANGMFRADLFYRLNVFPLEVPALRERRADIPMLVEYFIHRYSKRVGKQIRGLGKETANLLQSYDWPGNIRELQNVIERAVIIADSDTLAIDERWLGGRPPAASPAISPPATTLATHEKDVIEAALRQSKGRVSGPFGAAARLGVPSSTLESKIKTLKIDKRHFKSP
jgi:transcriptional regulator with GAF, ATPase, and Fis domain